MANYSRQRELIKHNMQTRFDHPTADAVYASIREIVPNISLGTVYRNLRTLVEQGDIISLDLGDGKEHFDGRVQSHHHFICSKCGSIQDIMIDLPDIEASVTEHVDGTIEGHKIYFYGICNSCTRNS